MTLKNYSNCRIIKLQKYPVTKKEHLKYNVVTVHKT